MMKEMGMMTKQGSDPPPPPPPPEYMKVGEIARLLGLHRRTVNNYINEGVIPSVRLGAGRRTRRVLRADFEQYLRQNAEPPPSQDDTNPPVD